MRPTPCLTVLACAATLFGCQAAVVTAPGLGGDGDGGPRGGVARAMFEAEVEPLIDAYCARCHADPVVAPVFVDPVDTYAVVMAYPGLVIPGQPDRSSLITKGEHNGPAWTPSQEQIVREWIQAEGGAGPGQDGGVRGVTHTPLQQVVEGENTLLLDTIGLPGATVTFRAGRSALGWTLNDLMLRAGTSPVYVANPVLIIDDGTGPRVESEDRFDGVELTLAPGVSATLASTVVLVGFPDNGSLGIGFETVRASY